MDVNLLMFVIILSILQDVWTKICLDRFCTMGENYSKVFANVSLNNMTILNKFKVKSLLVGVILKVSFLHAMHPVQFLTIFPLDFAWIYSDLVPLVCQVFTYLQISTSYVKMSLHTKEGRCIVFYKKWKVISLFSKT